MTTAGRGFCLCGCGQRTAISAGTDSARGDVKGQPRKYIRGHNGVTGTGKGYRQVTRRRVGLVGKEHVILVERVLGKPLPPGAVVHHVNGDKRDNSPSNLVVCQDQGYHNLLHGRRRALDACGNASWLKCKHCKKYGPPEEVERDSSPRCSSYHFKCRQAYQRERWARAAVAAGRPLPKPRNRRRRCGTAAGYRIDRLEGK